MINFKIGKESYSISEVKIKDLYMILEKQWYEGHNSAVGIVSQLSGAPIEDIKKLQPYQFIPLWNSIQELFAIKKDNPVVTEIKLNNTHYGLIHMDELTVGEIADAELILHSHNADYRTHELLAILYRPVTGYWGTTYTIEEYDSKKCSLRANDFLDLDVHAMRGATNFFLSFATHCTQAIADSLAKMIQKNPTDLNEVMKVQELLLKSLGPGTTSYTSARERILYDLNKHLDSALEQLSTILPEEKTKQKDLNLNLKGLSKP